MQSAYHKYNAKFQEALNNLNPQQLAAVNKMDGPVLVIAGPGTGKTQILAARIGKILTETDALPHEILCLTYTDAGAVAMRKRLFDFIGPDAYRVNIYTFHAFCNEVIQENLDYFGKMNLEPLSDLDAALLFRELVDDLGNDHLLKRFTGDVYYDVSRLKSLFSTMKREGWGIDLIQKTVDDYLADIPTREEFTYKRGNAKLGINVGDPKQKDIDAAKEKMNHLLAAVGEYKNYDAKMKRDGRYDYDDMIIWVLRAFRENEEILRRYQERYQYILVDEFQDTSGSQNELLKFILAYWETPNVFVVGDDDQSIFKFQGANMKNILDFASDYVATLNTVVLKHNYRSNQHILDISRVLIDNNNERLTKQLSLDKNLQAAHPRFDTLVIEPTIREYNNPDQEMVDVALQIEKLVNDGVEPGEIAVIYRNHSQVEDLVHFLEQKRIAVSTKRKINIIDEPFGEKIITILRYLAMELDSPYSGDELLFEILHYDFFNIPPIEIAKASVAVSEHNINAYRSNAQITSIRRYISEMKLVNQVGLFDSPPQNQEMKYLISNIDLLLKDAVSLTLQQFFQQLIAKTGILKYIMQQPNKGWYMQILTSIFNFLKDESRKKPDITAAEFVAVIDLMKRNKISLELNQVIFTENGVNFMTAHGSKGLEFEYVFLIGCSKKIWDSKGRNNGFSYPDTLTQSAADDVAQKEESRRLFYVALTRAKQCLMISYSAKEKSGKDQEASQFIGEILADTHLVVQHPKVSPDDMAEFIATQFSETIKPKVQLIDKNYIDQLLQNYTLSVTHLSNYLDCPLKFYFQNLIRVPSGKSPAATFGQAVHWALNRAFRALKDNNDEFPLTHEFMDQYRWYMRRNRDSFTKEDYKLRLEYGERILPVYYEQNIEIWNKNAITEKAIKNVEIDGIPIKGNLDKIEFNGKQVNVVDYKTGKLKNAKDKFNRANDDDAGGDYWRQAVFYKILIDHDRTNDWDVISTQFEFVEPISEGEYHKEKVVITPQDVELVTGQIKTVYGKILNHEFSVGCGKKECDWCHFVRSNFAQVGDVMQEEELE